MIGEWFWEYPAEYRRHGAFAEYVAVPSRILYKLPPSLPFEHAAMIEAVSVAVHAVGRVKFQPGDASVVVGARNDRSASRASGPQRDAIG